MGRIIYCFSGTGNSLRAAVRIAQGIGGAEVVSVRVGMEEGAVGQSAAAPRTEAVCQPDMVGFVCPVYEWDLPGAMKDFVSRLTIRPDAYVFLVATHILIHGRAFETMQSLLAAKGARLTYGYALRCVASQCTAYPPFPPERWMIPYMEKN